jgi:hypothetical protein
MDLTFKLSGNGQPTYSVKQNKAVILESTLGIKLKRKPALMLILSIFKTTTFNESWEPVLGEQSTIVNHYNEHGFFVNKSKVKMNIIFRVFDEGVAFRYDFPKQAELNYSLFLMRLRNSI